MAITYRLVKGVELTHEEMDTNLRTLDFKDYRTTTNPTENDDSSNGFEVDSKWTNTTTGDVFRCSDATVSLAVWNLEVQAVDKVVDDTDPTDSDNYDFIGQRWINKTVTGNDEVVNKIFIATAVTSNLFTWVQTYPVISSTGLEVIDDGNGIGWRLIGRDPNGYDSIGLNAVDFSLSDSIDPEFGATGEGDVAFGKNNFCGGNGYSLVLGKDNSSDEGGFSLVFGEGNYSSGYGHSIVGGDNNEVSSESIGCGTNNMVGEKSIVNGGYNDSSEFAYCTLVGFYLNATADYQTIFGQYNATDTHIMFSFGNGVSNGNRSNLIELYDNGALHIDKLVDTTANRPTLTKASNTAYFDTDLNKPIWFNGTDWVDATGTVV